MIYDDNNTYITNPLYTHEPSCYKIVSVNSVMTLAIDDGSGCILSSLNDFEQYFLCE